MNTTKTATTKTSKETKISRDYSEWNKELYDGRNPNTKTNQKEFTGINLLTNPTIFQYPQIRDDSTLSKQSPSNRLEPNSKYLTFGIWFQAVWFGLFRIK